jgi:hypothetical protein
MAVSNLKHEDHVARHVSSGKLKRNEVGVVYGCFPQAFLMRRDEEELSGSWVEFFTGTWNERLIRTLEAIKSVGLTVRPRDGLVASNIGAIHETCGLFGVRARVLHEPSKKIQTPHIQPFVVFHVKMTSSSIC